MIMDNIDREIYTDFIVNLLNNYIEYTKKYYTTDNDKDAILKFFVYLMKGE